MLSEDDCVILQKDIDYLNEWATINKMKFHPRKCKVLSVRNSPPPFYNILPCVQFIYSLGDCLLDYAESEKDLGVDITPNMDWGAQCNRLYSKANQQLGIVRRNAYFVIDNNRRRALYIALVRSQFENCSIIWRPITQILMNKIESLQKRAVKWILSEENCSYSSYSTYVMKCKQANLLPMCERFELNDLLFLHKVIYNHVPVELPDYLSFFQGQSRLRSSHLDKLSLLSSISPKSSSPLVHSFFYRAHCKWNRLAHEIRDIESHQLFKNKLIEHLWKELAYNDPDCILEDDYDLLLPSG